MKLSQFIPEIKIHPNYREPKIGEIYKWNDRTIATLVDSDDEDLIFDKFNMYKLDFKQNIFDKVVKRIK